MNQEPYTHHTGKSILVFHNEYPADHAQMAEDTLLAGLESLGFFEGAVEEADTCEEQEL